MERDATRELVLGLWKIHILHHAVTEGIVGHHLIQELRGHGYDVSPGTLYPLLHRMERNGWLRLASSGHDTHAARTYVATPAGADVLSEVTRYVSELYEELQSHGSEHVRRESGERRSE